MQTKAMGMELVYTDDKSNKFYRVLIVRGAVIVLFGPNNGRSRGQAKVHPYPQADAGGLINAARDLAAAKERKGYTISRDLVTFNVDSVDVLTCTDGDKDRKDAAITRIVTQFLNTSPPVASAPTGTTPAA
ncbi:WGR domain-containing protein [Nonomuraea ceibae]|uniref:WGR domain-containing protein n=1 Tax=Nonomuraea ceibae TaxID=1935170 RepID=UPI001C5FCE85|nr:WGR domain-containing protein [Nonomuraea ceibae]